MKKIILLISTGIFICSSCNFSKKKDIDNIISIVDNVESVVSRHDNNVQSSIESKNFQYINTASASALDSVRVQVNKLIIMDLSANQEKLRNSALNYIEALEYIIVSQQKYSSLTDSTTLSEAEKIDIANTITIETANERHKKYIEQLKATK